MKDKDVLETEAHMVIEIDFNSDEAIYLQLRNQIGWSGL